jgi:hypothetical protein
MKNQSPFYNRPTVELFRWAYRFFVLVLVALLLSSCGLCDGVEVHLYKVFEQQSSDDLISSFDKLVHKNTEILSDCIVINYSSPNVSSLSERLQEFNLVRYDVSYSCDILSFDIDLYKRGNNFYLLRAFMAPCKFGEEDVFFHDAANNPVDQWYKTDFLFEYIVIGEHINDKSFCTRLETKLIGNITDYCK